MQITKVVTPGAGRHWQAASDTDTHQASQWRTEHVRWAPAAWRQKKSLGSGLEL